MGSPKGGGGANLLSYPRVQGRTVRLIRQAEATGCRNDVPFRVIVLRTVG